MNTLFLLLARHDAAPLIPIEVVAKQYFELTTEKLIRKIEAGEILLPITRLDPSSQKSARCIGTKDLADYIDNRMKAAKRDCENLRH